MDLKSIVTENAWLGFNMDYGLLHMQLGTPVVTGIILLIVYKSLETLLFKPVLSTMDNRSELINNNVNQTKKLKEKISSIEESLNKTLSESKKSIREIYDTAKKESTQMKDKEVAALKTELDANLEKNNAAIKADIDSVKKNLESDLDRFVELTITKIQE